MGMTVYDLDSGQVFRTQGGIWAVKTEYHYPNGHCQCVLLASGEYAHFPDGDAETVAVVIDVPALFGGGS